MLLKEIKKIFLSTKTLFKIMIKFPARVRRVITQIASTRVFSQMPALISVGEIIRVSFAIFPSSRRRCQSKRNYGQFVIASCTCNWEKTGRAKSIEGEGGKKGERKEKKRRGHQLFPNENEITSVTHLTLAMWTQRASKLFLARVPRLALFINSHCSLIPSIAACTIRARCH